MRTHRLLVFPAAALGLAALAHADTGPDFARDVEPILAAACVRCHASSIPQGQLRLDTRDGLLKGGASGPVVVAGQAEASSLYGRLLVDDPAKRMPWMSEPLKPGEIATLRRWIDAGAPWPEGVTVAMARAAASPECGRSADASREHPWPRPRSASG